MTKYANLDKNHLLAWFPLNSRLEYNVNGVDLFVSGKELYKTQLSKSKFLLSGNALINNIDTVSKSVLYYFNDVFYAKNFSNYFFGDTAQTGNFNFVCSSGNIGYGFTGSINDVLYYDNSLTREEILEIKDYVDFCNSLEPFSIEYPTPRLPQEYDSSLVGAWMNVLSPYQSNVFIDFSDRYNSLSGRFFEKSGYAYNISGSYFYSYPENIKTDSFWALDRNQWDYYAEISGIGKFKNSQPYAEEFPIEISSTGIYSPNLRFIQNIQIYNDKKDIEWVENEYSKFLQNKTGLVFGTVDGTKDFSRFRNSFSYSKNDEYPFFTGNIVFNNDIGFNSYSYWASINSQQSGWANYAFDGANNFRNNVAFNGVMPLDIFNTGVSLTTYSKVSYLQLFTGSLSQDFLSRDYNKYKRFF